MLIAVKGNKQVKIDEAARQQYRNLGYDIAEMRRGELGIMEHSPRKPEPYVQDERLMPEDEELKAQLSLLKARTAARQPSIGYATPPDYEEFGSGQNPADVFEEALARASDQI